MFIDTGCAQLTPLVVTVNKGRNVTPELVRGGSAAINRELLAKFPRHKLRMPSLRRPVRGLATTGTYD
jgi:hypothetical protein